LKDKADLRTVLQEFNQTYYPPREENMAKFKRKGGAIWRGDLKNGTGLISTESQALMEAPYNFGSRFEESGQGTNPEELIAAAHAGCYSMAFANTLKKEGYEPKSVDTRAVCTIQSLEGGGFGIARMELDVRGEVEGLDQETFQEIARKADQGCPVSNLLREGLEIEINARLV
jgi:osmotically inducible protein OsmC